MDFRCGDDVLRYARLVKQRGYEKRGSWGLGQACWHLGESMRLSVEGVDRPPKTWVRRWIGRIVFWLVILTRRMPRGSRAPSRKLLPEPVVDEDEAIARLEDGVRMVELASDFKVHPIFGRLSPSQWRTLHWIHAAHHLRLLVPAPLPESPPARRL